MTASTPTDRRHVLEADDPYLANLSALWACDPGLARRIEAIDDSACYPIETARDGLPTAAVATPDGRKVYLHSRYHPCQEAQKQLDGIDFEKTLFFYVQGFGLGYLPAGVFERASAEAVVCVFESDLALIKTAMFALDLSRAIRSNRLIVLTTADKGEMFTRLTPFAALQTGGVATVVHTPSLQLHPAFHEQARVWSDEFASYTQTNLNTLVINGGRTAENVARNLGWYLASPSVSDLKDRHKGQPAIVVAAGPSLRKNKHLLAAAQGRAVLVAVQTILQPLLEMGVEPNYVTSLDYHEICTRFFERLPANVSTHLVAEPKAAPAVLEMYPGPVSILGNDFAESLVREMSVGKAKLTSGATVAHLAYYLAEHLGCDPIIFVGQDLGFSDGLCYAPGTSYEDVWRPELGRFCTLEMKQWEQIARDRHILRQVPDQQGRPMYTEQRLYTYLQQFERDFALTRTRIIDATEGGVMKRGATVMTLREALNTYCQTFATAREDSSEDSGRAMCWDRLAEAITCVGRRRDEAAEIEQISRQTLPLLEEVRDHLGDHGRVNRAIARIDPLRSRMNALGPCYDLVTQLTQQTEMDRFKRDRAIAAAKVDPAAKQRLQVQRDIDNVRGVMTAAGDFQKLMVDVLDRLERDVKRHGSFGQAKARKTSNSTPFREAA